MKNSSQIVNFFCVIFCSCSRTPCDTQAHIYIRGCSGRWGCTGTAWAGRGSGRRAPAARRATTRARPATRRHTYLRPRRTRRPCTSNPANDRLY